jgi:hypothetical protein
MSTSNKKNYGLALALVVAMAGCATSGSINQAINNYLAVADQVQLGQSKKEVLDILLPAQQGLSVSQAKASERYIDGDTLKEIYFMRSRSFSDGLVTDDEFTPYVFEDGKLVAIGWTAIGGPKTQAQPRDHDVHTTFHGRVIY